MKRLECKHLLVLPYLLVIGAALLRLEPSHPYNLVPVFSCLAFFAAMRPSRELALPFFAFVGVDVFLTTHQYGYAVTMDSAVTWAWYLVVLIMGAGIFRGAFSLIRLAGFSLLASVFFFFVSNFAVWLAWNMYPRTLGGLDSCYVAALPFFRNSAISELAGSVAIFGLYRLAAAFVSMKTTLKPAPDGGISN